MGIVSKMAVKAGKQLTRGCHFAVRR